MKLGGEGSEGEKDLLLTCPFSCDTFACSIAVNIWAFTCNMTWGLHSVGVGVVLKKKGAMLSEREFRSGWKWHWIKTYLLWGWKLRGHTLFHSTNCSSVTGGYRGTSASAKLSDEEKGASEVRNSSALICASTLWWPNTTCKVLPRGCYVAYVWVLCCRRWWGVFCGLVGEGKGQVPPEGGFRTRFKWQRCASRGRTDIKRLTRERREL